MYNVRFKTYELSAKDIRINQTILLTWMISMFAFMFGLFFGKGNFAIVCMLLMFASIIASMIARRTIFALWIGFQFFGFVFPVS